MKVDNKRIHNCAWVVCSSYQALHAHFVRTASLGPELYFHLRCLACLKAMKNGVITQTHAELLYAALTAWGMNSRKAQLEPFAIFWRSLKSMENLISGLQHVSLLNAKPSDWDKLHLVWSTLRVTNSGSKYQLVGKSKILAHLVPHWIAPIDRAHTLAFLTLSQSISATQEDQWQLLRDIHEQFFARVAGSRAKALALWVENASAYGWDSSIPKAIDNLVWGVMRPQSKKKRK